MTQPLRTLRQFVKQKSPLERCEICSLELFDEHPHLIEPARRQILCSCNACAILFTDRQDGKFKRIPRQVRLLQDFQITDPEWDSLKIPIGMAFFFNSTAENRTIVLYPSPAGPTESLLPLETWGSIVRSHKLLENMQPDVEALLVNRVSQEREYYIAPVDECYRLVGLIRASWRGLSGGTEAWQRIHAFFSDLKMKATAVREEYGT